MWLNKATSVNIFMSFQFNLKSRADHVIVGQYFYMICWFTCRSNGVKWIIPCEVTLFGKNQIDINTIVNCSWTLLMTSTCDNIFGIYRFNVMSRDSLSSLKWDNLADRYRYISPNSPRNITGWSPTSWVRSGVSSDLWDFIWGHKKIQDKYLQSWPYFSLQHGKK